MPGERDRPPDRRPAAQSNGRSLERLDWVVAHLEREVADLVADLDRHFTRRHEHEAAMRDLADLNQRLRTDYPSRTELQRDYLSRVEYAQRSDVRRDVWLRAPLAVIAAGQLLIAVLMITGVGQ